MDIRHTESPSTRHFFEAIAQAALVCILDFKPQGLSNTAWAFAKLNHETPKLFEAIARAAQVHFHDFNAQGLANTAWSFATMHHDAPALLNAIANAAQVQINEFSPQALSNTAWSFAALKHAIARAAQVRINDFTPQNLSNTAWLFATLNHEALPAVLDAIALTAQVRIDEFNPQDLSNTAWSFAALNHEAPSLFESMARASQVLIHNFNQHGLANMAWSFAVFDMEPNFFIPADSPFAQALLSRDPSMFSRDKGIVQLHQFQLWCKEQTGASWYPEELSQLCQKTMASTEKAMTSRFQNDVVATLGKLHDVTDVKVDVSTPSGYSLDAVVVYRGVRIGVEVDGPTHFVGGSSQSPNSRTILKHRQIRALERSLKLVSVPYWEWDEIDNGSNKERRE
jgi:RAP domain